MEDFNIYGWSALHEACYKGYVNAIIRFLDYAKETGKNLIEMKTIDDYKTTPIIIAALGGHLDVIQLLVNNGADVQAKLNFLPNVKHGIIEVAAIRQHIELLVYMNDKITDIPTRLRDLMVSEKLDPESRATLGRTIETLSNDYPNIVHKLSKFKSNTHEQRLTTLFDTQQIITYYTVNHESFGSCLSTYIKLCEENQEGVASGVMILLNVLSDDQIRKKFNETHGIAHLIKYMMKHKEKLGKQVDLYNKIMKQKQTPKKTVGWSDGSAEQDDHLDVIEEEDYISFDFEPETDSYIECASIGHALNALTKYEDSLRLINQEGYNEKIIGYIRTLFDWNGIKLANEHLFRLKSHHTNDNSPMPIMFEQYIGPYILCLANMTHKVSINKACFAHYNLFELILSFWKKIEHNFKLSDLSIVVGSEMFMSSANLSSNPNEKSTLFDISTSAIEDESGNYSAETVSKNLEKIQAASRHLEHYSHALIKNLKLAIIECVGKVLCNNFELKTKYVYPCDYSSVLSTHEKDVDESDWPRATNRFIKMLITYLDSSTLVDREIQMEVLKFIRYISENDPVVQNRLVNTKNANKSSLINNFRNLLRKSSPLNIRTSAMYSLWSLSGDKNYQEAHDRKCILYRAVGAQKFVDTLFDSTDELSLICLEALISISNGPPYRDNETNQLIKSQDDVAKVHAAPAVLRLLKVTTPSILFGALKTISAMCVTSGYINSIKNQSTVVKLGGLNSIIEICSKKNFSSRLRCEAYYSVAMICLNNSASRKALYKIIATPHQEECFIKDIMNFLVSSHLNKSNEDEPVDEEAQSLSEEKLKEPIILEDEMEEINTQLTAGLVFCGLCFCNEDFMRKIVLCVGRINWSVYKLLISKLEKSLKKSLARRNKTAYFDIQKLRCLLGFQLIALHNLICMADEDPRAIGIKLIIDIIPDSRNTFLRSIACDYIGRLVRFNDCLIESFLCVNTIEILGKSSHQGEEAYNGVGECEMGNAAVTLGFFTSLNPEARRRLLKVGRKSPKIMESLKYSNDVIHIDLVRQWRHFKELHESLDMDVSLKNVHRLTPTNQNRGSKHFNKTNQSIMV